MTPMKYANTLLKKSCEVADAYNESTLNNILIEKIGLFSNHSLQEIGNTHPHAYVSVTTYKEQ